MDKTRLGKIVGRLFFVKNDPSNPPVEAKDAPVLERVLGFAGGALIGCFLSALVSHGDLRRSPLLALFIVAGYALVTWVTCRRKLPSG